MWSIYEPNLVDKFINKLWGIWVFNRKYFAYEIENMEKELIADTKHYVLFGGICSFSNNFNECCCFVWLNSILTEEQKAYLLRIATN